CPVAVERLGQGVFMFETLPPLPATGQEIGAWTWEQIAPYYADLEQRALSAETVETWLLDWTSIAALVNELNTWYSIATTVNTADSDTQNRYATFLDKIQPQVAAAEQRLKEKLLASGLEPAGFAVTLRKIRTDAALYREANVPLLADLRKLEIEYDNIAGARTVMWDGQEVPLTQLRPALLDPNRERRERAYRTRQARIIQDTPLLADVWRRMMALRAQVAANAGYPNYREYRWQQLYRYDYTPDDAKRFHEAIAEVVVPAVTRLNARRRERLGVPTLRPWDLDVDPTGKPALRPYSTIEELESKTSAIFGQVDPQFGHYFETMRAEHLLDLDSRKNKAPGGYSLCYNVIRRPFIFMNSTGTHNDVQTLLHEGGHAFNSFEMAPLPYLQQRQEEMLAIEFAEVASMGMELLASPYLAQSYGGFYTEAQAARARAEHLATTLAFWPYMAMIDALQHWVYEHQEEAADIERCDDYWVTLVDRFMPDLDWSGLEQDKRARWHGQGHVFQVPFYYIEYGMAQLGAVQLWANAIKDQAGAVAAYRRALALGAAAPLPELYSTAGIRFAFDSDTLRMAVDLIERTLEELEPLAREG
ncbi:MAG TPA: M3 family oligoendopeptidase, partial [Ktedonobacterales bacterium]|nr:M3 family oligoendopeptidase [Ktedonobacterales bacterium]